MLPVRSFTGGLRIRHKPLNWQNCNVQATSALSAVCNYEPGSPHQGELSNKNAPGD